MILLTKVHIVKAIVKAMVVMYRCGSWTIKKAECWRIDAFELWCWRRPFRVPWTARRWNQSILKEISPEYSLEGLMLKLKLQYFGHLATWCEEPTHQKRPWCWKRLRADEKGGTEDELVEWQHQFNGHEFEQALGDDEGQGRLECCGPWGLKEWTTMIIQCVFITLFIYFLVCLFFTVFCCFTESNEGNHVLKFLIRVYERKTEVEVFFLVLHLIWFCLEFRIMYGPSSL